MSESLQPSQFQRIASRRAEIGGGIGIDRVMPSRQRRSIGAWCFLDHAGPAQIEPGHGLMVGAHPHIGLQTFTWMIAGEIEHRDSLGNVQVIRPGQVNLMTAGNGITHTEESLPDERQLHAAQLWIALPRAHAAIAPAFENYPELPRWSEAGIDFTLLAGSMRGYISPCRIYSPLVGVDIACSVRASTTVYLEPAFEHGLLVLEGGATINGEAVVPNELVYLAPGLSHIELSLADDSRALLIGGQPLDQEIVMWWNFVGTDKAGIAQAQRDWEAGSPRFGHVEGYEHTRLTAPALVWK
jgi:redox-sensitive bicupin YhaK (pirin superfamily)